MDKICTKCRRELPLEAFYPIKGLERRRASCRDCHGWAVRRNQLRRRKERIANGTARPVGRPRKYPPISELIGHLSKPKIMNLF